MCESKITPKNYTKGREGDGEKKKRVGDGEGVPRRLFQKPVKVFPSANTKICGSVQREMRPYPHTHTHNTQYFTLKICTTGQWYNFDLTRSMIGRTKANCFPELSGIHSCMNTHTHTPNEPFNTPTSCRLCKLPRQCPSPLVSPACNTPAPDTLRHICRHTHYSFIW